MEREGERGVERAGMEGGGGSRRGSVEIKKGNIYYIYNYIYLYNIYIYIYIYIYIIFTHTTLTQMRKK